MSRGRLTELGSGLKVATRALPQAQSLSVGIWVNAGARDERDSEMGIAQATSLRLVMCLYESQETLLVAFPMRNTLYKSKLMGPLRAPTIKSVWDMNITPHTKLAHN